jgi:formate dehydrogenase major subunit
MTVHSDIDRNLIDRGTPERASAQSVSLEIDGIAVTVPAGTSLMRAASLAGIQVPKLCATDSLEAFGSCRLCLVEIEGRRGTPASCTTPAENGMKVTTQNDRLAKLRRGVMELYISDHPLDCLTCAANGDCELQDMAGAVGLREVRYGYDGENHLGQPRTSPIRTSPSTPSKCIVCSRCVRACEEVQGTFALTIDERGFASHVSAGMNETSSIPNASPAAPACRPARRRR